jgi:hypothetical protein
MRRGVRTTGPQLVGDLELAVRLLAELLLAAWLILALLPALARLAQG